MFFSLYLFILLVFCASKRPVKNDPRILLVNPISSSKSLPTPRPVRVAIFAMPPVQMLHKYTLLNLFQLTHLEIIFGEYMIGLREKNGGVDIIIKPWEPQYWLKEGDLEHELWYQFKQGYTNPDKIKYAFSHKKSKIEQIGLAKFQQIKDFGCVTEMSYDDVVERIKQEYDGSFDNFRNNCVHFANYLYKALCGKDIPYKYTRVFGISRKILGDIQSGEKVRIKEHLHEHLFRKPEKNIQ